MTDFYGTAEGFIAYWTERGNVDLAALDTDDIDPLLIVASEWSDGNYREQFPGWKTGGRVQEREWPRQQAFVYSGSIQPDGRHAAEYFAADEIPSEQVRAVYELAAKAYSSGGTISIDFNASDAIKRASVDGAVSVEFVGASDAFSAQTVFPIVDAIMAPLLVGNGAIGSNPLVGSKVRA